MDSLCPVVVVLKSYYYLIKWLRKQVLKFFFKKWVFPKNGGDGARFGKFVSAGYVRLMQADFMRWVIFSNPPQFFRKSQKTDFRENQKRQKCDFGHFLTSDVIHIFSQCLILKSTYRTNETFFSRTHSFGWVDQTSVGGWSI